MKKLSILIISIAIALTAIVGWNVKTYSQTGVPYPEPKNCIESVDNEISIMRTGWNTNLQLLLNQEKPTSEMVDEAYDSMRTYRCWLNYLCEAVLFSGHTSEENLKNDEGEYVEKLTREHIDPLPGCMPTKSVEIPGTQLKHMPLCYIPGSVSANLSAVVQNHDQCLTLVDREFAVAAVGVERALKGNTAKQKNRAFTKKMNSILEKMHSMQADMVFLREQLERFDAHLPCYVLKCD